MKKILCIVGTRPEIIKMAPIIHELKKTPQFNTRVVSTAQHRELLTQMLNLFDVNLDDDLNIMREDQTLPELTSRLALTLDTMLGTESPDIVLAQGDTTTVLMSALACFYRKIPFAHVEAGLRTHDSFSPFPEEMNRVLATRLSHLHFAPTETSRKNLMQEGVPGKDIYITGNTVIDALFYIAKRNYPLPALVSDRYKLILVTSHRRENFGNSLHEISRALKYIVENNQDVQILFPVHPNPSVRQSVYPILSGVDRVILCDPLDYGSFVTAMKKSYLILSDSGGVQEEAPALSIPVLVLREKTERPEATECGVTKLVGSNFNTIVDETQRLLNHTSYYREMAKGISPYGDGKAAERIVSILKKYLLAR